MRRFTLLALGAILAVSLTGPAGAAGPEVYRYDDVGLSVSWRTTRDLEGRDYLRIWWYVGAYRSTEGSETYLFSDLYRTVSRCERQPGRDQCRFLRWSEGWTDLEGATFSVDRQLTEGSLEESFRLRDYSRGGERVGTSRAHVAIQLEGVGDIDRSSYSFRSGDGCYRSVWRGRSRGAEATGTIAGEDIALARPRKGDGGQGDYDAWLSDGGSISRERTC